MEKTFHVKITNKQKKTLTIFKSNCYNKEVHYILIKGSIHEEDITITNIYVAMTEYDNI